MRPSQKKSFFLFFPVLLFLTAASVSLADHHKAGHGKHVHGKAKLSLALENSKSGEIVLESPGMGIIGFEHDPKNAKQKKQQESALLKLREGASQIVLFPPDAGCKVTPGEIQVEKEDGADHNEVHANFKFECEKSVSGGKVSTGLHSLFKKTKTIELTVLGRSKQVSKTLKSAKDTLTLP